MRIKLAPQAAAELESQFDYLIQQGAARAAHRLALRCDAYFENVLGRHPRTGKHIAEKDVWEAWIPGTRLVVWYRFSDEELQIVRIWHCARNRWQA